MKFFKRHHRGGLKESVETQVEISQEEFNNLINSGKYKFYAYDERVNQYLWLLKNIEKDYKNYYEWVGIC